MSRRSMPERFRRGGNRPFVVLTEELADRWIAAWGAVAETQELALDGAYWDIGGKWIARRRATQNVSG